MSTVGSLLSPIGASFLMLFALRFIRSAGLIKLIDNILYRNWSGLLFSLTLRV